MEIALIVLGIAGVSALAFIKWSSANRFADTAGYAAHAPQSRTQASPAAHASSQSFDAASAEHLPSPHIMQGSAYAVDGHTIVIDQVQIRLFGIDAPELNHPEGQKAKWAMAQLCKGQKIKAEVTDIDAYGSVVAKCFLPDGRDLSAEMVGNGMALDRSEFSGGLYRDLETADARKRLWLVAAKQDGKLHVKVKPDAHKTTKK